MREWDLHTQVDKLSAQPDAELFLSLQVLSLWMLQILWHLNTSPSKSVLILFCIFKLTPYDVQRDESIFTFHGFFHIKTSTFHFQVSTEVKSQASLTAIKSNSSLKSSFLWSVSQVSSPTTLVWPHLLRRALIYSTDTCTSRKKKSVSMYLHVHTDRDRVSQLAQDSWVLSKKHPVPCLYKCSVACEVCQRLILNNSHIKKKKKGRRERKQK